MRLLAIDTTGANCSVALRVTGEADVCATDVIGRGHAEHLAPMVKRILDQADVDPKTLTHLATTTGPGSFAGTRVGVAFMRGLALVADVSVVGISNLDVWGAQLLDQADTGAAFAAVHDAKRGEVIIRCWSGSKQYEPQSLPVSEASNHVIERLGDKVQLGGSGAELLDGAGLIDSGIRELDLVKLLDLAAMAKRDAHPPSPFYARPPDAKLPGGVSV
jgi:tRNA threonylcarbamoyladenosine biosynthesis protein TsaB